MIPTLPDPFVLISQFWQNPLIQAVWTQIAAWWWVPAPFMLYALLWRIWVDYNFNRWAIENISTIYLELVPPKEIDKSPRAMERVLLGFHGIHKTVTPLEAYIEGQFNTSVNLEIHGTNKSTRFFVRVWDKFRNLVEAQVYAQYPKAEIRLLPKEDNFMYSIPANVPNEEWEMFGAEYGLRNPDYYPLASYIEDELDKEEEEERKIDPIANLVEIFNTLKDDQQIWVQYKCTPHVKWKAEGEKKIRQIAELEKEEEISFLGKAASDTVYSTLAALATFGSEEEEVHKKEERVRRFLTPSEHDEIAAIDHKISKHGFFTSVRWAYITPKQTFDKTYVNAMQGAFKQWGSQTFNDFKWGKKTSTKVDNFFKRYRVRLRQRKMIKMFRWNDHSPYYKFIANTEELATMFHLPGRAVPTPTLRRVEAKKSQAPGDIPLIER